MKVSILGTEYTISYKSLEEDSKLEDLEGYTDNYGKKIVIIKLKSREYFKNEPDSKLSKISNKILRHEIIHAFLFESGLDCNSDRTFNWAINEEMVDWFALQSPKIYEVYKELGCLDE